MKIYMKITNDEYELPEYVADSMEELARILGVTAGSIRTEMRRYRLGIAKHSRYAVVEMEEEK